MQDKVKAKDLSAFQIRIFCGQQGEYLLRDLYGTMSKIQNLCSSVYREPGIFGMLVGAADYAASGARYPDEYLEKLRQTPSALGKTNVSILGGRSASAIAADAETLAAYVQHYTDQRRHLQEYQNIQQQAHEVTQLPTHQQEERLAGVRLNLDHLETTKAVRDQESREQFAALAQAAPTNDWLRSEIEAGKERLQRDAERDELRRRDPELMPEEDESRSR